MRELAAKPEQPFFLAVGFANPHVPWVSPKKYWNLYKRESIELPPNQFTPESAPQFAAQSGDDFYWYCNVPEDRKISPEFGRECLHGYLAAISYVDNCIGRLLDELDRLKLRDNTIIIFWGDHGYYMGEHSWWGGKHNNYEGATPAPLMIAVPGQKTAGRHSPALVEFVDIYPAGSAPAAAEPPAPASYTIAIIPFYSAEKIWALYVPFVDYLKRTTGNPWELKLYQNHDALLDGLCNDRLAVALLGPAPVGRVYAKCGARPFLVALGKDGMPFYRSILLTSDPAIRDLGGLRGRKVGFFRGFTASHIVPAKMLRKQALR